MKSPHKSLFFILFAIIISFPGATAYSGMISLPETGQNDCYGYQATGDTWAPIICTGTGEDGEKLAGASWPSPRFINNEDGTITDTLVGYLQWMKDANCLKTYYPSLDTFTGTMPDTMGDGGVNWDTALNFVNGINSGLYPLCRFGHTDWRLPNRNEIASLINFDKYNPAVQYGNVKLYLEANGFTNIRYDVFQGWAPYWSSTTRISPAGAKTDAYIADLGEGLIWWQGKNTAASVPLGTPTYWSAIWPVRSLPCCDIPMPEVCDGIDNDFDGITDEGLGSTPTTCGIGACASTGTLSCLGGGWYDSCVPGTPSAEVPNNGIDDDCNPATPAVSANGSGYNYPLPMFRASMNVNVNTSSLGTSSLSYYYTRARLFFVSTSITGISVSGGVATVTGTGKVNGVEGYTFTATITDGTMDAIGLEIRNTDGTVYSSAVNQAISGGNYTVVGQ